MFAWLRPSDAHNLEGDERYRLRPALERLHHTDKCALKPGASRSSSSSSLLRRSTYRRHSCGSAFRQFNATSVQTGFVSCPTDWVSFSGNGPSSFHHFRMASLERHKHVICRIRHGQVFRHRLIHAYRPQSNKQTDKRIYVLHRHDVCLGGKSNPNGRRDDSLSKRQLCTTFGIYDGIAQQPAEAMAPRSRLETGR